MLEISRKQKIYRLNLKTGIKDETKVFTVENFTDQYFSLYQVKDDKGGSLVFSRRTGLPYLRDISRNSLPYKRWVNYKCSF